MNAIEFDGKKNMELRLHVAELINIPAAKRNIEEKIMIGRTPLHIDNGITGQTTIQIAFNYIGDAEEWGKYWRNARKWLSAKNTKLKILSDKDFYRKVYHVELEQNERATARIGKFNANFVCDPYEYAVSGVGRYNAEDVRMNLYSECAPVYFIHGEGTCTLNVNGNKMIANIGQNITIDTERRISYRTDGTIMNTSVSGDYEGLYLQEGVNDISISQGFELEIVPNWRCI